MDQLTDLFSKITITQAADLIIDKMLTKKLDYCYRNIIYVI